jgi:hypothetical protein
MQCLDASLSVIFSCKLYERGGLAKYGLLLYIDSRMAKQSLSLSLYVNGIIHYVLTITHKLTKTALRINNHSMQRRYFHNQILSVRSLLHAYYHWAPLAASLWRKVWLAYWPIQMSPGLENPRDRSRCFLDRPKKSRDINFREFGVICANGNTVAWRYIFHILPKGNIWNIHMQLK